MIVMKIIKINDDALNADFRNRNVNGVLYAGSKKRLIIVADCMLNSREAFEYK